MGPWANPAGVIEKINTKMAICKNIDFGYFIGLPPLSEFLDSRFVAALLGNYHLPCVKFSIS
jgi:hypothetical protein